MVFGKAARVVTETVRHGRDQISPCYQLVEAFLSSDPLILEHLASEDVGLSLDWLRPEVFALLCYLFCK